MCDTGKIKYASKNQAWNAKVKMRSMYHGLDIYKCSRCGEYHLGDNLKKGYR